jgi:hypothetical protein
MAQAFAKQVGINGVAMTCVPSSFFYELPEMFVFVQCTFISSLVSQLVRTYSNTIHVSLTKAITLYTFLVLVLRKDKTIPKHTAKVVVVLIWISVALVIGIPNAGNFGKYYGVSRPCMIIPLESSS